MTARSYFVVADDGDGRYWYDTAAEARAEHGDLPIESVSVDPFEV